MYELFILLTISKFSIIDAHSEIIASITSITNIPSNNPYIIPPVLSNCFITGNSANIFDNALNIISSIFVNMNNPIATATFILNVDTCFATILTVAS